jgi:DNA-binding CsgD family transcriptional regulator
MGDAMAKLDTRSGHLHADETQLATNLNQARSQGLSGSEAQILLLIAAGRQTADIAAAVGTDQVAVKEHVKSILRKAMGSRQTSRSKGIDLRPSEFSSEMVSPFIA